MVTVVVAVVGSGAIGRWLAAGQRAQLLSALDERYVRDDDAYKKELDGINERADRSERAAQLAIANADAAMSAVQRVELTQRHLAEQIQREILKPLRDIAKEQLETSKQQAATATLVAEIVRRLDRMHPAP